MGFTVSSFADVIEAAYGNREAEEARYAWETSKYEQDGHVIISNKYYYKAIPMKDTFWRGSWTLRVADAEREAFMLAYEKERSKEMLSIQ